ncbi:MAG: tripartite tricarboxylate transporter substrate binding protein [Alphaproteobacteria bacterium]|nr:tripartite tricarboxylate transporter substrate binding protein [Alphaproteobacteria bacterium]
MNRRSVLKSAAGTFVIAAAGSLAGAVRAQPAWPTRPVTFVIPFAAGGALDQVLLPLKPLMEQRLGQTLLYNYKDGASGQLGWELVLNNGGDGSTVGAISLPHLVNTVLFQRTRYKLDDFAPVALISGDVPIWFVHKDSPFKTVQDAIDEAKRRPNQVRIAIGSFTGEHYITVAMVEEKAGVRFRTVNVGGGGRVMTNVAGRHFDLGVIRPASMAGMRDTLRGIGVVAPRRSSLFPEAPTFDEMFPDWRVPHLQSSVGVLAHARFKAQNPAGFARFAQAVRDAAHTDTYKQSLERGGRELNFQGPEDTAKTITEMAQTMERYRSLIQQGQASSR